MKTEKFPETIDIQNRVARWVERVLNTAAMDRHERALRFLEESIELVQAVGVEQQVVWRMVDFVYSRKAGETRQELGGVGVTLLGLSQACGEVLSQCVNKELDRIDSLTTEKVRQRQEANSTAGIGKSLLA